MIMLFQVAPVRKFDSKASKFGPREEDNLTLTLVIWFVVFVKPKYIDICKVY